MLFTRSKSVIGPTEQVLSTAAHNMLTALNLGREVGNGTGDAEASDVLALAVAVVVIGAKLHRPQSTSQGSIVPRARPSCVPDQEC